MYIQLYFDPNGTLERKWLRTTGTLNPSAQPVKHLSSKRASDNWVIGLFTFPSLSRLLDICFQIFNNYDYETYYRPNWIIAHEKIKAFIETSSPEEKQKLEILKDTIELVLQRDPYKYYLFWYL